MALFGETVRKELPSPTPDREWLAQFLASSVFVINIRCNDHINNLMPNLYASGRAYSSNAFAELLISNLTRQLIIQNTSERMRKVEARKVISPEGEGWNSPGKQYCVRFEASTPKNNRASTKNSDDINTAKKHDSELKNTWRMQRICSTS